MEELNHSLCGLVREVAEDYQISLSDDEPNQMFRSLIRQLSEKEQVVILLIIK